MDFGNTATYTFELWSSSGSPIADISKYCHNRTYSLKRNDTETLTFDLDLYAFEGFAKSINQSVSVLLEPYAVDVKVKRNGSYLFGTQIISAPPNIGTDYTMNQGAMGANSSSFSPTITVNCQGYLDLFKDRYVTHTYTGNERVYIAGNLITLTQAATNGDVGVTLNATQYDTGIDDTERTYTRSNVKDNIQNLAALTDAPFDFAFDASKIFSTYEQIGADRTDLSLVYGGDQGNIIGFYADNSATSLFNVVIGLGSGIGDDQLVSIQEDATSESNYFRREDIKQYNSVIEQATLDSDAATDLALEKDLLRFPQVTISGAALKNLNFLTPGDRINCSAPGITFLDWFTGKWRIEQMDVTLDDNDFEQEIRLYLDNYLLT